MKKVLFALTIVGLFAVVSCKNEGAKTETTDSTKVEAPAVDTNAVVADTTKKVEEVAPAKEEKKADKKEVKKEEKKK